MTTGIIGFCRFSFFGRSDTKLSYEDREAAFATLYDPARMETRFVLFENLLLKAIAGQSNKSFMLHVMTSDVMPAPYKARLRALCGKQPNIRLHLCKSEDLAAEIAPILTGVAARHDKIVQFRIDDDDALSVHFIKRLHRWAKVVEGETLITLPKGLMLFDEDGTPKIQPFFRNLTGAGFAYVTEGAPRKNVFQFAHIASGRRYPAMADPTLYSHIQTFTSSTDTHVRAHRRIAQYRKQMSEGNSPAKLAEMTDAALAKDFPYVTLDGLLDLQALANAPQTAAALAAE